MNEFFDSMIARWMNQRSQIENTSTLFVTARRWKRSAKSIKRRCGRGEFVRVAVISSEEVCPAKYEVVYENPVPRH